MEDTSAKDYNIQVSDGEQIWETVFADIDCVGGIQEVLLDDAIGRYIRMDGRKRSTIYGYSIVEFEVYGDEVY